MRSAENADFFLPFVAYAMPFPAVFTLISANEGTKRDNMCFSSVPVIYRS